MAKRQTRISSVRQEPSLGGSHSPSDDSSPSIRVRAKSSASTGSLKWLAAGVAIAGLVAAYITYGEDRSPVVSSQTPNTAATTEKLIPGVGVRQDVMDLIRQVEDSGLSRYGEGMARDLQRIMTSSEEGGSPLDAWESLIQGVACANHFYGLAGVDLYAKVKLKTIDTALRRDLYQSAQEKILQNADRDVLAEAQNDLSSCVKY